MHTVLHIIESMYIYIPGNFCKFLSSTAIFSSQYTSSPPKWLEVHYTSTFHHLPNKYCKPPISRLIIIKSPLTTQYYLPTYTATLVFFAFFTSGNSSNYLNRFACMHHLRRFLSYLLGEKQPFQLPLLLKKNFTACIAQSWYILKGFYLTW